MPKAERHKTSYPGVVWVWSRSILTGKPEKVFFIRYRREGCLIEERAGWQHKDDMTAARAAAMRAERIRGHFPSNQERRDARRAQAEAETQRMTFDKLWALYLEHKPGLKGRAQDESRFRRYIQPTFGDREPKDLVPLDLDRLRLRLLKSQSPQSVKHVLALLRRLVKYGVSRGLCQPLTFPVEVPEVHNEVLEDLTNEQLVRLLQAIEQDSHPYAGPILKLALFLGLRKGELLALTWQDIDLAKGFLRLANPKGGRPTLVPINSAARDVLERLPRAEGTDYVFPGKDGKRRQEIRRPINRIRRAAGLPPDFRPLHGLRHHFASALASSGQVTMPVLQRLLTHRSPSTTMRYSHLRDRALQEASELAGRLITEAARWPEEPEQAVNEERPDR